MFSSDQSLLLIIDVQGKLASLVHDKEKIIKNIQTLIETARVLEIPIILTEQVPEKIGRTIPEISQKLENIPPIVKMSFSCAATPSFNQRLASLKRHQLIITGIEAHVCVYQTTADLIKQKFLVEVVADAVSSRTLENKTFALDKIKTLGAGLTSTEMIITELLKSAAHEKFREVLKLLK